MTFSTVINCMDGRVQLPVIQFLKIRFQTEYVDTITEAGPNLILAEHTNEAKIQSILERLEISIKKHNSVGVAVVGHHDCAGYPASKKQQLMHLNQSMQFIRRHYNHIDIIGLWVDENWNVHELDENTGGSGEH
ncbi:carbonic anhydrase [Thermodesulfobacteriota bacterium]